MRASLCFRFPSKCVPAWIGISLLTLLAGVSCNDDTTKVMMPEYKVEASFSGRVLSVPDGATVPGASYQLSGTTTSGVSDAQGVINLTGLKEGSYQLIVSAPGHAATRLYINVAGGGSTSGPMHLHQDLYLAQNTGSMKVTLIGSLSGTPAVGAKATLGSWDLPGYNPYTDFNMEVDDPNVPKTVVADSSGIIEVSGLPATEGRLEIDPYDENGDGMAEYQSTTSDLLLKPGSLATQMIMLQRTYGSVEVVSTNLPYPYGGEFADSTIFLVYSTVMDTSVQSTRATLTREYPEEDVPVLLSWTSPVRLEIRPAAQAAEGDYELHVYSKSATGVYDSWNVGFQWVTGFEPSGSCNEPVTGLQLLTAADPIDFNTNHVALEWSALACAGGYKIYAKDDRNNPNWILVREDPTDYDMGTITSSFQLPESFDRYQVDDLQTPFAGIRVTFSVVPKDAGSPEPGGSHASVSASDIVPPALQSVVQIGSGLNTTGQSMPLGFRVALSEFMAASVSAPTLEIKEGANPEFILDPNDGPWKWDAGRMGGSFDFTLPSGADASGDSVRVVFDRLEDLSGNVVAGPVQTPWAKIETWGGEFDFEGSGQGWMRTGEGWAWGTPTIGPQGAHGGNGCWATNLSGTYGTNWNTDLTSPPIYVPTDQPMLGFWRWYYLDCYDDFCRLQIISEGQTHDVIEYTCNYGSWQYESRSLSEYAGRTIQLRFHFTSNDYQYSDYPGFFLDDVKITSHSDSALVRLY